VRGDDVISPYLQVQDGIKTTYQETQAILLVSFHHLAERVTPSLNKAILPHPIQVLCFFHLEHKDLDLLRTTIADNRMISMQTNTFSPASTLQIMMLRYLTFSAFLGL
jgi:hypothetical protein